jgi:hypothetical protein
MTMARPEVEQVLYNWISQANSPIGVFTNDEDRAEWVARNFLAWWKPQVRQRLASAHAAARRLNELRGDLGIGPETEAGDEAFHLLESLQDDLRGLHTVLGIEPVD